MSLSKVRVKVLSVSLAILFMAGFTVPAQTPQRKLLSGHLPVAVSQLAPLGGLDGAAQLDLSIGLPLRDREGLTRLVDQLYDPASALYHHYLEAEEFDARFGPTEADYQAVIDWATANGFTISVRHPNRLMLQVTASVADVERAFQVTMRTYPHPTESRTFFSPDAEPSVSAGVPVIYIGGLENFAQPRPKDLHRSPLRPSTRPTPEMGSGPNGNLGGFDYRAVYAPGLSLTGTGQSVGLLEFDGYYPTDISTYETQMQLPGVALKNVRLDGFNGDPSTNNGEVALDIEMAISMAPGLSEVVVFESKPIASYFNTLLQVMSTNTAIKQFSCSWLAGAVSSSQRTNMDTYFLKFASQGQSFFDASGDDGATSGAILAPDDDPYITLVGGTTLATAGPGGPWLWETAWNAQEGPGDTTGYATGGGVSTTYNIPPWQKGVNMSANNGSTSKRNTPDVAMVADNIFIVADNGQQETTGGTSASAPLWAGFAALLNQRAVAAGLSTIGFVNPAIYQIATNAGYHACFDDITVGNNTNTISNQYLAVPGYDLCTGWGSPSGGSLMIALLQPDGFQITPGRGPVANGPVGGPFTTLTQSFLLTNTGVSAFNWALGSTSAWLNVSSRGGALTPGAAATVVSATINSAANQLPAGVYAASLWFTNLTSGLAQLRQFTIQVGQELVQDGGFEAGDFTYWVMSGDPSMYTNNLVDIDYNLGGYSGYSPYAGNYFAALGQAGDLAYFSQPIATRAGQLYLLSFWLENPLQNSGGPDVNEFVVQWNTNSASVNTIFNQTGMGAFSWTNYQFTVQAGSSSSTLQFGFRNDDDYFCLDSVSVIPVPVPVIQAVPQAGGALQLRWSTLAGVQYQPQYKTNLAQAGWLNLGAAILASGSSATVSDTVVGGQDRFYRVMVLP